MDSKFDSDYFRKLGAYEAELAKIREDIDNLDSKLVIYRMNDEGFKKSKNGLMVYGSAIAGFLTIPLAPLNMFFALAFLYLIFWKIPSESNARMKNEANLSAALEELNSKKYREEELIWLMGELKKEANKGSYS